MKNRNLHVMTMLLLVTIIFSSCNTKKNMAYLRDLGNQMTEQGAPAPPEEVRLRPNDNLFVSVKTINPEINALFTSATTESSSGPRYESQAGQHVYGYQIDVDGNITLPIIGKVRVAGLTLSQAQAAVQKQADEYLNEASIQVKLLNYKISVMGEVKSPGVYYNYNNAMTILEAIGMAGGITEYASLVNVSVIRKTDAGTKAFRIDLTKKSALRSEAFYIYPNDAIYIDPQSLKNTRLNSGMYALFLSSVSTLIVILKYLE
ncbi:MAG: polysaccharide biosynthesis/export family protein [Prolixibacteraceae bacterium]